MTSARRSEIFAARWEWLDRERRDLELPDSKTGPKRITLREGRVQHATAYRIVWDSEIVPMLTAAGHPCRRFEEMCRHHTSQWIGTAPAARRLLLRR
jgi:hypothetical protein